MKHPAWFYVIVYVRNMDSHEIRTLVALAKNRDQVAFGELYDMYASRIYRFISLKVPVREQAEDLLQETFLKAWQALPKLKLENLYFGAWLYKIARNLTNDFYRKVYRTPVQEDIEEHYELAANIDINETISTLFDIERVRAVMPKLKPEYRQVLELRFVQEFSVEETARVMGKSKIAVRLTQHRALKRLHTGLLTK